MSGPLSNGGKRSGSVCETEPDGLEIKMQRIEIDGNVFEGYSISTANSVILIVKAPRGFLGCGYFSPETAEKVGDAAVIVKGVKNFDDMLEAEVKAVSPAAASLGITAEMTGKEALLKLI